MKNEKIKILFKTFHKNEFTRKKLLDSKNIEDTSIKSFTKYSKSNKFKDYLRESKNFILNQKILSRNPKLLSKSQLKSNSSKIRTPQNNNLLLSYMSKTIKNTSSNKFFLKKNIIKNKRNYSAYYINGDLNLRKKYIGDILDKANKISEINKKIKLLGKTLNISTYITKPKNFGIINKNIFIKKIKIKKEEQKEISDISKVKFNIKGTHILSPFCKKVRDKYMIDKFSKLLNDDSSFVLDKKSLIDNKLNILYAENQKMYLTKLKKINKEMKQKGKREKYKFYHSPSELQLRDMKNKVTLIKEIFNVAYPNTALMKIRNKIICHKNKKNMNKTSDNIKNNISN